MKAIMSHRPSLLHRRDQSRSLQLHIFSVRTLLP